MFEKMRKSKSNNFLAKIDTAPRQGKAMKPKGIRTRNLTSDGNFPLTPALFNAINSRKNSDSTLQQKHLGPSSKNNGSHNIKLGSMAQEIVATGNHT